MGEEKLKRIGEKAWKGLDSEAESQLVEKLRSLFSDPVKVKVAFILVPYIVDLRKLGIVSGLLVGRKRHEVYVCNVFREDMSLADFPKIPAFLMLGYSMQNLSRNYSKLGGSMKVKAINPKTRQHLEESWREQGIETCFVGLN